MLESIATPEKCTCVRACDFWETSEIKFLGYIKALILQILCIDGLKYPPRLRAGELYNTGPGSNPGKASFIFLDKYYPKFILPSDYYFLSEAA